MNKTSTSQPTKRTYLLQVGLLLLLSVTLLSGCGARNSPTTAAINNSVTNFASSATAANCNQATSTGGSISVALQAYVDTTGNVNPQYVQMKFLTLPSNFYTTSSGPIIRISAWTASPSGYVYPDDSTPQHLVDVQFNYGTNQSYQLASNWGFNLGNDTSVCGGNCPVITWLNLASNSDTTPTSVGDYEAQTFGATFTSASTFWADNMMLLDLTPNNGSILPATIGGQPSTYASDPTTWKALRVEVIDTSGNVQDYVDMLIPVFALDPNVYAGGHPSVLNALHPLNQYASEGWSAANYQSMIQQYCSVF